MDDDETDPIFNERMDDCLTAGLTVDQVQSVAFLALHLARKFSAEAAGVAIAEVEKDYTAQMLLILKGMQSAGIIQPHHMAKMKAYLDGLKEEAKCRMN